MHILASSFEANLLRQLQVVIEPQVFIKNSNEFYQDSSKFLSNFVGIFLRTILYKNKF